jgi:hypothetical protein
MRCVRACSVCKARLGYGKPTIATNSPSGHMIQPDKPPCMSLRVAEIPSTGTGGASDRSKASQATANSAALACGKVLCNARATCSTRAFSSSASKSSSANCSKR